MDAQFNLLDRYWRAANYLTVGQIYLQDNPLLREPLRPEHIKPRLLGHWGTSPGLQPRLRPPEPADPRARRQRDLPRRPGPRRPGARRQRLPRGHLLARSIPRSSQDEAGHACACSASSRRRAASRATSACRRRARSTKAASSATCSSHAFGAAFDNPDLIVAARGRRRRGRDRARSRARGRASASSTRPATARCCRSSTSTATRSPARPCSAATDDDDVRSLLERPRLRRRTSSRATIRRRCIEAFAGDARRAATRRSARSSTTRARRASSTRPRWPAIVLRTPKGWTGPEGRRRRAGRGHLPRAPGAAGRRAREPRAPRDARGLDAQLPAGGALRRRRARSSPSWRRSRPRATGAWARTRTPTAAGLRAARPPRLPRATRVDVPTPGDRAARVDAPARRAAARHLRAQRRRSELPAVLPRRDATRTGSAPSSRSRTAASIGPDRPDRRPRGARRPGHGGAERAHLPGLARGLPAHRPARPLRDLRGVRDGRRRR